MSTVTLHFTGPSIWVPHEEGTALLAVLPNGTHLGKSAQPTYDKRPLARHWPVVWEESYDADGNQRLSFPEEFLGSRLVFRFFGLEVKPAGLDLSAILPIAANGWVQIAPKHLEEVHQDVMGAQILLEQGRIEISTEDTPCDAKWSDGSTAWPVVTIPIGLTATLEGVERIEIEARSYIEGLPDKKVYYRNICDPKINPVFWIGNLCAEGISEWVHNSDATKALDRDFHWIYGLSENPEIVTALSEGKDLRVPLVNGSDVDVETSPLEAFKLVRGGGGNVGCECRICIDKPRAFDHGRRS